MKACADRPGDTDLAQKLSRPRALSERYLCRAFRVLTPLLNDSKHRLDAASEMVSWGRKAVVDFQKVVDADPGHFQNRWELHDAQRELGIAFLDFGSVQQAIEAYKDARATTKLLCQRHGDLASRMVWLKTNLAFDDFNLLEVLSPNDAPAEKFYRELVDEALSICEKLDVVRPLSNDLRKVRARSLPGPTL